MPEVFSQVPNMAAQRCRIQVVPLLRVEGMTDKRPMRVQCGKCDHIWPAAYLPMEMGKVAALLKRVMCPMCGAAAKDIFCLESTLIGEVDDTV